MLCSELFVCAKAGLVCAGSIPFDMLVHSIDCFFASLNLPCDGNQFWQIVQKYGLYAGKVKTCHECKTLYINIDKSCLVNQTFGHAMIMNRMTLGLL